MGAAVLVTWMYTMFLCPTRLPSARLFSIWCLTRRRRKHGDRSSACITINDQNEKLRNAMHK